MLVWVVLLCLCAALPNGRTGADECMLWSDSLTSVGYRARHGMVACTPRATWSRYLFGHLARLGCLRPSFLTSWRPLGASHGALTHDCLVHARGLVGPAPLRIVDAPNLPTALTVLTRPMCLPWEMLRELISSEERPLRPFLGGNSRRWRLVSWSRPLTWWGMPSRGAARRSCRTRAGGHSGMGSRMRAG